mgnify:CR=1 FL=1
MSEAAATHANELCAGTFPELIGLVFTEVGPTLVRARLPVRPELFAPNGYLHGSVVTALAETACGFGTAASRPEGLRSRFATIELACNFLGTARHGWIACEAVCSHAGRTTQVWDARVWREDDERQIALLRLTQLLLGE